MAWLGGMLPCAPARETHGECSTGFFLSFKDDQMFYVNCFIWNAEHKPTRLCVQSRADQEQRWLKWWQHKDVFQHEALGKRIKWSCRNTGNAHKLVNCSCGDINGLDSKMRGKHAQKEAFEAERREILQIYFVVLTKCNLTK